MKTAFFLGAGTSKTFGYPLTGEILPMILQRLLDGTLFRPAGGANDPHRIDRARFRILLDRLVPGWKKAFDAANPTPAEGSPPSAIGVGITDLLTLVDHTILTAEAEGTEGPSGLATFRELLERAIYEVLQPHPDRVTNEQKAAHEAFANWVFDCTEHGGVSVVSTNYDLTLEEKWFARLRASRGADPIELLDLGYERRDIGTGAILARPAQPASRLLKLHGALNWLRCPLCGHTYVNPLGDIGALAFTDELTAENTCHCNPWARLRLPIVAPSLARTIADRNLKSIWDVAMSAMQEAERWFVIGYSMPAEDVAIRSLLTRAAGARANPPPIVVIQQGRAAEAIYRALFPDCAYYPDGLAAYLAANAGRSASTTAGSTPEDT